MLKINDKTFLNIQEAVQWLLDNNALPFQCTANYAANTEIGLGTIVNPTMAKVRIGSLIFFADSKVSTVTGVTSNGFIVSDQYNDLVDDVVYVSNVQINASGHLIVTLSNGTNIDAGLIKQVAGFSIDASQHLIVTYNDGSTNDLGAIFAGNVTISGNLAIVGNTSVNGDLSVNSLSSANNLIATSKPIIETLVGYTFNKVANEFRPLYVGVAKNGYKLTFVIFGIYSRTTQVGDIDLCTFTIPSSIGDNLRPYVISGASVLDNKKQPFNHDSNLHNFTDMVLSITKNASTNIGFVIRDINGLAAGDYFFRIEETFLLSSNLAA